MEPGSSTRELIAAGYELLCEALFRTGAFDRADDALRTAHDLALENSDLAGEGAALNALGMAMHYRAIDVDRDLADSQAEEQLFARALTINRRIKDPDAVARSLFGIGLVHQVLRRDWASAMPYFHEALSLAEVHSDALVRSEAHRHVGFFHLVEDVDWQRAVHHLRVSHDLRVQWGDPRWIPSGMLALAEAEVAAGLRAEGIQRLRDAVELARAVGLREQRIAAIQQALHLQA